jgi:hypothetical protein
METLILITTHIFILVCGLYVGIKYVESIKEKEANVVAKIRNLISAKETHVKSIVNAEMTNEHKQITDNLNTLLKDATDELKMLKSKAVTKFQTLANKI